MSLFPTKTRLALLRAVAEGRVEWWPRRDMDPEFSYWRASSSSGNGLTVTARIEELKRAGWATQPKSPGERWRLTDAGRAVLAQADAKEQG